ncbi:MAG TPA: hypothetical protein VLV83_12455 [Acidobacteriota bacterium]|nr:hypothetical protein [Acidobacteriota bacterium]
MKNLGMLLLACLLSASCASPQTPQDEDASPSPSPPAQEEPQADEGQVEEIEGTLAAAVEAGGWILKTEDGEFLLLDVEDYRDQPWFQEGARLRARGRPDPEAVTIHMQGTPFRLEGLQPAQE